MKDLVECHSGFTYAERPKTIYWEGKRLEINRIEKQARTQEGSFFRVRVVEGDTFDLHYNPSSDQWRVTPAGKENNSQ